MQVGQHHVGGGAVGVLAVMMVMGVRMVLTCLENHPLVGARTMGECHVSFPIVVEREEGSWMHLGKLGRPHSFLRAQLFFFFTAPNYAGLNLVRSKRRKRR